MLGSPTVKAVSLFTGAGGLDLGCEAAGFLTVAAVENNEVARQTLLRNRERWLPQLARDAIFGDIITLNYDELLERAALDAGEATLLHGGPPCTPFSKSGYWLAYKRAGNDPKASLLDSYVDALRAIKPKAFLMENVYGLAYGNQNRPVLERFIARVRRAGYSFDKKILLAADYGAPQLRQRLFCVGIRRDLLDCPAKKWKHRWPQETHSGPHETRQLVLTHLPAHRTVTDAFAGLTKKNNPPEPEEIVDGTFVEELGEVPPGDNYLFLTAHRGHPAPRFVWRSRYWTFLLKLHPDRPAPTIQGQPGPWVGPFHWENRRLRTAEIKRLMEFPDEYVIEGTRRDRQLQIGNAVPLRLAQVVAASIRDELDRLGALEDAQELAA
jgi:DNA (cytosine-5)-methyltransferase 1